ncbi:MAG TPA: MarR family transcriptional regulator [Actinobacteria bacterium]|nr:hypothetical protein BMS3Bbin01_01753 [bacterium BMS3Bbin01]HDK44694.1 MarR family transcriptional regulator [Actinomycetota bacterium]
MSLSDENSGTARHVETSGSHYAAGVLPRTGGRLIGWLMVCGPPGQSTSGLVQAPGTSKSSESTMSRLLEQMGFISRYRKPGSCETCHRVAPGARHTIIERRRGEITSLRRPAEHGIAGDDTDRGSGLAEMRDAFLFWEREWPALMERWKKETT